MQVLLARAARRLVSAVALVLLVISISFAMIHAAPGDAALVLAGEAGGADMTTLEHVRRAFGLDRPLVEQFLNHLGRTARGDLGYSYLFNRPVSDLIAERMGPTLALTLCALVPSVLLGVVLGISAARRPGSTLEMLITSLSVAGLAMPVFWMGIVLMIVFGAVIPIAPVGGMRDVTLAATGLSGLLDRLHHLMLPALTLALVNLGLFSRLVHASLRQTLDSDFIRTARSYGLPERVILYRHALRHALMPLVSAIGVRFSALLSGAVLVEAVFSWPGLGDLALDAIMGRDTPTLLGLLVCGSLVTILVNVLCDLILAGIDPRLRTTLA